MVLIMRMATEAERYAMMDVWFNYGTSNPSEEHMGNEDGRA
jgi:hypothetical protein